jgi:hypothetical protein
MQIFFAALLFFFSVSGGLLVVVRAQSSRERNDMGVLRKVSGPVCIRKGGREECTPTKRGDTLRKGDILRVKETGVAVVRCYCPPPKEEPNTNPLYEAVPCPNSCARRLGSGGLAAIASLRPDVLTLRIPPLAGADAYRVTITGPNIKWSTDVTSQKFDLPADAPKLDPGVTYALSVADNRSPEKSFPALNISLLSEEESNTVRAIEKEIRELDLTETEKQLRVAELYAAWGINIEALNIFENIQASLSKQEKDKSHVDLLLTIGDLYLSIGMVDPAGERYGEAYALSKKSNDLTQQAYALEGLGLVYAKEGQVKDANTKFLRAITTFEMAGNINEALRLNQSMEMRGP